MFEKSVDCKQNNEAFISYLQSLSPSPLVKGYEGVALMLMARHVFNPFKKWQYFNEGKKLLDSAIAADGGEPELRFLRYCAQNNAPGFLGYAQNLAEDKAVLLAALKAGMPQDDVLLKKIGAFMLKSNNCSPEEIALVKKYN